jgi:hypothetical protein
MLGRYSAAWRVARTLYLGSAPTQDAAKKGLEDRQIKLGCVQPGETSGTFGDVLRKSADQATYLYVDGSRYWYAMQLSVNRLAEERAERYHPDDLTEEIQRRLAEEAKHRGDFARVHVAPAGASEVVDEPKAKLVIVSPDSAHSAKAERRESACRYPQPRFGGPELREHARLPGGRQDAVRGSRQGGSVLPGMELD